MAKTHLIISLFLIIGVPQGLRAWSWDSAENLMPSLREDLDKEIATYRQQVNNGMSISDRIAYLDRLVENYKPLGLNMVELEIERSRLRLEEKQSQLRASEDQDQATALFDRGVAEYRAGQYKIAFDTFREAERLLPTDTAIKELRRKLSSITPIVQADEGEAREDEVLRRALTHYLENDPKRSLNALLYSEDKKWDRPEIPRLRRLIETDHPEIEMPKRNPGVTLIDHKLQLTLESIYDGRYLSAISECNEVLDLEPANVLALTRLGSAYFAMNEKEKARQIWTKALANDPNNQVLRKFLFGAKGATHVE